MDHNQITLPAVDLVESVAFYRTLGLRLIVLSDGHYAPSNCPRVQRLFPYILIRQHSLRRRCCTLKPMIWMAGILRCAMRGFVLTALPLCNGGVGQRRGLLIQRAILFACIMQGWIGDFPHGD